jgi:hypothetical protein
MIMIMIKIRTKSRLTSAKVLPANIESQLSWLTNAAVLTYNGA